MKKLVPLALVLCMCLALLAGCGSDAENSSSESSVDSTVKSVEEASENSDSSSSDTEDVDASFEELPDGDIKDAITSASANLHDGTAFGKLLFISETDTTSVSVDVKINSSSYADKDEIAEEFVSFAEELCSACEDDFSYSSLGFSLYVDNEYIAILNTTLSNGHFYAPLGAMVMDDSYSQLASLVEYSSDFATADENSDLEGLKEYFNSDTTTDVVDGTAMIYIPVEKVTAENLYSVAGIFFDDDRSSELYMEMGVSRTFSKLDRYVFRVCTADQEQILDFIYEYNSDTILDFDATMEYNEKYAKEIAEFSDMT